MWHAGLYGVILPPLIYVEGVTNASNTNASFTLTNMHIVFGQCHQQVWEPVVANISAGPDVSTLESCLSVSSLSPP